MKWKLGNIQGAIWGDIRGLSRDNGKENTNYNLGFKGLGLRGLEGLGFRLQGLRVSGFRV